MENTLRVSLDSPLVVAQGPQGTENGENAGHLAFNPRFLEVPPPDSLDEAGLPPALVEELVLKGIYHLGRPTGRELAEGVALPFAVIRPVLDGLRSDGLCEIVGSRGFGETAFEFVLSDKGREKVLELQARRQYYGTAPVPFNQYLAMLERQRRAAPAIHREDLQQGLDGLVVSERMLRVLGPALNSGEPILFYGASGNGKTSLAVAMGNVLSGQDPIWVPRVIEVDGQLIQVYDPMVHEPLAGTVDSRRDGLMPGLNLGSSYDRRWVLIKRPVVVAGGELTMNKFELSIEPTSNLYHAPYQMKANGGTLLIDDFGRQTVRPQDILNRWIVPMEKHTDYLTMLTGQTIELPLNIMLIFATNLRPNDLMDEAYLRRLRYRIPVPNPSAEQFRRIFQLVCAKAELDDDPETVDYLCQTWYETQGIEMRACHPRDIVAHILDICRFEDTPPRLTPSLVDRACTLYFTGHPQAEAAMRQTVPGSSSMPLATRERGPRE